MDPEFEEENFLDATSIKQEIFNENPMLTSKWALEITYPNEQTAVDELMAEEIWSVFPQKSCSVIDGRLVYYRCNRMRINSSRCSVLKCLFFPNGSNEVWRYKTTTKHTHNKNSPEFVKTQYRPNPVRVVFRKKIHDRLENRLKFRIAKLMKRFRTPKKIMQKLESEGFDVDNCSTQIRNYLFNLKKKDRHGSKRMSKWTFEKSFCDVVDAKKHVRAQNIWNYKFTHVSHLVTNFHYRCGLVPREGLQCAARKYISVNKSTNEILLYKRNSPHTHDHINRISHFEAETHILLKRLYKPDQRALVSRGFRVLKAVGLHDCLLDSNVEGDFSIHDKLFISQQEPSADFSDEAKDKKILWFKANCKNEELPAKPHFTWDWIFEGKFPNEQMGREYLVHEDKWTIDTRKVQETTEGRKLYYRCNRMKLNGPQCPAWKCLLYTSDGDQISLYRNDASHSHDTDENKFRSRKSGLVKPKRSLAKRRLAKQWKQVRKTIIKRKIKSDKCDPFISNDSQLSSTELVTGEDSFQYVINYVGDGAQEEDQDTMLTYGCNSNWICEISFPTSQEAQTYLKLANWAKLKTTRYRGRTKINYRCNMVRKTGPQCAAEVYLLRCAETGNNLIYRNMAQHTHDQLIALGYGLPNRPWISYQPEPESVMQLSLHSENSTELITFDDLSDNTFMKMEVNNDMVEWCQGDQNPAGQHDLSLQHNRSEMIMDSYLNAHTIMKEELIIEDEPVLHIQDESDAIINDVYFNDVHCLKIQDVSWIGDKTTELLTPSKASECPEEIVISDDSDDELLNGDDVEHEGEWLFERKCGDYKTAKEYIRTMNLVSFQSKTTNHEIKDYHRCNFVFDGDSHCPASRCLQYENLNSQVFIYNRNVQHMDSCPNAIPPLVPIQNPFPNVIDLDASDEDVNDYSNANSNPVATQNQSANIIELDASDDNDVGDDLKTNLPDKEKTDWVLEKEFETYEAATDYIKNENIWQCTTKCKPDEGFITFYECSLSTPDQYCAAAKYIQFKKERSMFSLYKNERDHTHDSLSVDVLTTAFEALDDDNKKRLMELSTKGHAPEQILETLKYHNGFYDSVQKQHLSDWIRKSQRDMLRKITSLNSIINIVLNWLPQISEVPKPDDEHGHYCVSFEHAKENFRCFLSTRRLLKNAMNSNSMHIDSSALLHWQKSRVILVGTTDVEEQFHLFGIAITSQTYEQDYEFIFRAVQKGVQECHHQIFKPEYLIADENENIRLAFLNTFGIFSKICTCPKVALSQIVLKLSASNIPVNDKIREDFVKILKLSSRNSFKNAVDLFFKKWRPDADEDLNTMLNYLETTWIERISNWFEVLPRFAPDTNKAIRFEYALLNKNYTFRQNLPISIFQFCIKIDLEKLSRAYAQHGPKQIRKPAVPIPLYEKAIQWKELKKEFRIVHHTSESHYYIPAGDEITICEEKYQKYRKCKYQSLDEFFDNQFSFWCLILLKNGNTLSCNCPFYLDNFMCEHSLGMASVLKLT